MKNSSERFEGFRLGSQRRSLQNPLQKTNPAQPGQGNRSQSRLLLDPLEPRVLLNADTLAVQLASLPNEAAAHDVLVQMVNDTVAVGTQTQTVQRVEVVNQANGAVLALGDLSEIRTVTIASTKAADLITLDTSSFGTNTAPALQVQGDGMTALAIDHSGGPALWQLNGDGSGIATGAGANVSFTGVASVTGAGNDTLQGPSQAATWQLTGAGAGNVAVNAGGPATNFQGFAQLDGAASGHDTFNILPGGSLTGGIQANAGGFGALAYVGGQYGSVQSVSTAPHAGSVTVDGVTTNYTGIDALTLPDPANTTVSVLGSDAVLQDASSTGMLQLSSTESGTTTFAAPTQNLTVNLGNGTGGDTLTIQNLDARFASGLTVNANGSGDTVNVDTSLATHGGAVSITADNINVGSNATMDTRLSGGASGAITFAGMTVALDTGSELRADALGAGGTAGNVTLGVSDLLVRPNGLPFDFEQKVVSLNLEGATVLGADIMLNATDSDTTPDGVVGTALNYLGDLVSELASIPGAPSAAFPGIDASVVLRGADAHVVVDNSTITSTGTVTLDSTTVVTSGVTAIANLAENGSTNVSVAVGYGEATSTVDADVTGSTHIMAAGDVTISATGTLTVAVNATAQANVNGKTPNNDASSIGIAIGYVNLTDQAIVGNAAVIDSTGGSVNVLATGTTSASESAATTEFTAGFAGVSAGLTFDDATVNALVDGTVTAAGQVTQANSFNGANSTGVNLGTGTFTIPNNGLTTGEAVTYDAGAGNTPIGGLVDGTTYYVLAHDANTFQLSTVPPILLDATGTNPASTQTLTETTTKQFILDPVDTTANTLYLPGSGFNTGDLVTYNANGNTAIGGLSSGVSYVVTVAGDTVQFTNPNTGTLVTLSQNGASGTQIFTDGADVQTVAFATVDNSGSVSQIDEQGHGFTQGEIVTYDSMSPNAGDEIGGLTNGTAYSVNVVSPNAFQLIDLTTDMPVALTDPGDGSLQALSFISKVDSFNPATAVNATTATISLPGNDLTNGQSIIYSVDPALTSQQTVYGQTTQLFSLNAIDPNAHSIVIGNNGFNNGDSVTYSAGGNTAITGLTDGVNYTVQIVDANTFQLLDGSGNVVPIAQGGATGTQTFTDNTEGGSVEAITLATMSNNAITLAGNGFTEGETVAFSPGPAGNAIRGLTANATYLVHLLSADTFELENPGTHAVQTLTAPAGVSLDALTSADTTGQLVNVPDQAIAGLQDAHVYYVVKVDANTIRLVANADQVAGAMPITLTSYGTGTQSISAQTLTGGIGVNASLTDTAATAAAPAIGSGQPDAPQEAILGAVNSIKTIPAKLSSLFGMASATGAAQPAMDANGSTADTTPAKGSDGFSATGALVVNVLNHTVQALVGANAADTRPAVLSTPGSVTISAMITDATQADSTATVTEAANSSDNAVAVSIAVNVFTNTAFATIGSGASVDSGQALTVASAVMYPFLVPIQTYIQDTFTGIPGDLAMGDIAPITSLFTDGTLGLASNLLNDQVVTQANTQGDGSVSVSGSIGVNVYNNTSQATIASGAKINQNTAIQNSGQSVAVTADTMLQIVDLAGIGSFGVSVTNIASSASTKLSNLIDPTTYINPFGTAGGKALGGSIMATSINDTTVAVIDPGAMIHIGAAGSLVVAATEMLSRIEIASAGGSTGSGGTLAFAGSGLGYRQRSDTEAELESGGAGGAAVTGDGAVSVTASTGGLQIGIAGALVKAGSSADGIGVSVLVNDIQRNTYATLGPDVAALNATPAGTSNITASSLSVTAETNGQIIGVGVAGVVLSGQPAPPKSPTAATNGATLPPLTQQSGSAPTTSTDSGIGIAGSALVNVITDNTAADIDTAGTITAGTLTVDADNGQTDVLLSGGVVVSQSSGGKGGTNIGGAFALNLLTADTEAHADAATFTVTGQAAAGTPTMAVTATTEGEDIVLTAALSADTSVSGKDFAGSVSINRIVDTTNAQVDSATVTQATLAAVTASNAAQIIAVGGGVAATAGATGIGASIGFNQIAAQTTAEVTGANRRSSLLVGGLTVSAVNNNLITAVAISAGVAAGANGNVAGAFTLGINIISTSPSIFSSSNGDAISATISNATVTSGGAVTVSATDNSVIQSLAGAVGVGAKASAFGVGLSWNEIVLNIQATIDDATVKGSSVSLISQSTQNAGLIGDKIATLAVGGAVSGTGSAAVGASVSVNGVQNTIASNVQDGAIVTATGGDVDVTSADTATIGVFVGGAGIAPNGNGIGVGAGGNYIDNTVQANVAGATAVSNTGNVTVSATEGATIEGIVIGLGGGDNVGLAASLSAGVITNHVLAQIGDDATVTAGKSVSVLGTDVAGINVVAGQVAIGGEVGVGASLVLATILDTNIATISGLATVAGAGGVDIDAETGEQISIFAVGGAVGGEFGVGGSATATVINDTTTASVGAATSPRTGTATVAAGAPNGISGDVDVTAHSTLTILGTAGALAVGGSAGIGAGADVGVVTLNTDASIGQDALVTADGNIAVKASESETVVSISATGAGGADAGIAASAGVSVLDLTTQAWIDSGAVATAGNNVVVSAEDDTTETQVAGSLGAGGVGVGVAAAINTITKDTESWIASSAAVTANADGAGITADTGDVALTSSSDPQPAAQTVTFSTASVGAGGEITALNHGLTTGEAVVYSGAQVPLQGLRDNAVYYVIRDSANTFRLAATQTDAENGIAIDVTPGDSAATAQNAVQALTDAGVPDASSKAFNGAGLLTNPFGAPVTASQRGVVVVAVSTNNLENAGGAGAGGGVGVAVAGAVAVDSITTKARIDPGASVTSQANVAVNAGRSYREVTIGLGAAGAGVFAAAPGLALPILTGTTSAQITGNASQHTSVTATGNVSVTAIARENIVVIAAGVAGAGEVAIAGSAAVIDVNTVTQAIIGGADGDTAAMNPVTVMAGGNVVVQALHIDTGYAVAGAVGIGIGGGAGAGAVAVTLSGSTTQALIEDGARVDANGNTTAVTDIDGNAEQGVVVQALTNHTVYDIAGSGAGGLYAGIAGAVDFEQLQDVTTAAIESGAQVNQDDAAKAAAAQAVDVAALDELTETVVAGALGVSGVVGVGAGVDVDLITNTAQAYIGDADVAARGTLSVDGDSTRTINSDAIAVGAAGAAALGGGIAVLSIGSGLTGSYTANNDDSGTTESSSALNSSNGSVLGTINSAVSGAVGLLTPPSSGSLPAFDPATSVSGNTIAYSQATGLNTGDTVTYSADGGTPIGGLTDGHPYFVIVVDATHIELADSYNDAIARNGHYARSEHGFGRHQPADAQPGGHGEPGAVDRRRKRPNGPRERGDDRQPRRRRHDGRDRRRQRHRRSHGGGRGIADDGPDRQRWRRGAGRRRRRWRGTGRGQCPV